MEYVKGQTVEIGFGTYDPETEEVEDGSSLFLYIDVESVTEKELEKQFGKHHDILYIQPTTEAQSVEWSKENLYSQQ